MNVARGENGQAGSGAYGAGGYPMSYPELCSGLLSALAKAAKSSSLYSLSHPVVTGAVARAYALARGVPPEAILCEAGSRTTFENLLAARALLGPEGTGERLLLVSDPLHMARALAMARELGLDAAPAPTPTTRFKSTRSRLRFLLRESYYLAGYLARRPFARPPARWPAEGDPPPCE